MLKEKEQKKQENKEYLMQQQQTLKSMSFICSFFLVIRIFQSKLCALLPIFKYICV